MKKTFFFLCLLWSASLFAVEVVDRIVAVVGNEIITLSDLKGYSSERSSEAKTLGFEAKDPLESLIREKLFKLEMERIGVAISAEEIEGAVQEVLQRNQMTLEALKSELSRKGTPLDRYKKDLGDQIRRMKFLSQVIFPRIKLTEEEIARATGNQSSEEARFKARMELLQSRSSEELVQYLDEARAKTYVEIKK